MLRCYVEPTLQDPGRVVFCIEGDIAQLVGLTKDGCTHDWPERSLSDPNTLDLLRVDLVESIEFLRAERLDRFRNKQ